MLLSSYIIGEGTLPLQCAERLLKRGHDVRGIISPDTGCHRWARERGIPFWEVKPGLAALREVQPFDYLLSIVNQAVLPEEVLSLPRMGAINYHDGPLPRYAGTQATSWALLNGEKSHGITWHRIVTEVDAGDIYKQRMVEISEGETAVTLNAKCYEAAIAAFNELLDELAEGRAVATPQDLTQRTYYARHQRPAAACVISWKSRAEDISALVRALDFGPYQNPLGLPKVKLGEEFLLVRELTVSDNQSTAVPGTIITVDTAGIRVSTPTRDVLLKRMQSIEGAERSIEQLIREHGLEPGVRLPELSAEEAERLTALNAEVCKHESYWVKRLAGLEPVTVPYGSGGTRQTHKAPERGSVAVRIPDSLKEKLRTITGGGKNGHLLLAAFGAFLSCLGGMAGFDIGFSQAAIQVEMAGLQGLFASFAPLRVEVEAAHPIESCLEYVHLLLGTLSPKRTFKRDVWARFPKLKDGAASTDNGTLPVAVEFVDSLETRSANVGATLTLRIVPASEECCLEYDRRALDDASAQRIAQQFEIFLAAIAANPSTPVGDLPLVTERERMRLLVEFNSTKIEISPNGRIHEQFELQAAQTPDATALSCRECSWTFRELNQRAEAIALRLRESGAGRETIVGVCMERTVQLVAAMLGVMKSGAAYLPVDATYPADRIAGIVEDAQPLLVLADRRVSGKVAGLKSPVLYIEDDNRLPPPATIAGSSETQSPSGKELAYVIYTSGSTGKPKGVMVEHRNVANFFVGMDDVIGRDSGVWLAVASVSFDISILEIWWPLTRGFHVVLWPGVENGNDASIPQLIRQYGVTHMQGVPSFMRMVLSQPDAVAALASMRVQVMGGEAVPPALVRDLGDSPTRRILDMYGPTETTVISTHFPVAAGTTHVAIGKPIANTRVYVLNSRGGLMPIGLVGELHIGGAGVTRGYLNRPELNAEKFIPDPFGKPGERMYRTGDLVRFRDDGNLDYVGRVDGQVKIRGHRVEVGEIETRLCSHPDVRAGVIDVQADAGGENRIVAYIVPVNGHLPTTREFRDWMSRELPAYMVPFAFVKLDALPRTANGKLDRRALPSPESIAVESAPAGRPATELESALQRMWADALGRKKVGLDDDFFELGGNSLIAVQLLAAVRKHLSVEPPLQALFESPAIAKFAAVIEKLRFTGNKQSTPGIQPIARQARVTALKRTA